MSRGQVLQVLSPSLTNAARAGDVYTADFQVALSWSMAPVTDIVAYLNVGYSGIFELVADSIAFSVEGLLRNEVGATTRHAMSRKCCLPSGPFWGDSRNIDIHVFLSFALVYPHLPTFSQLIIITCHSYLS